MVSAAGFEPASSCLSGRYIQPLKRFSNRHQWKAQSGDSSSPPPRNSMPDRSTHARIISWVTFPARLHSPLLRS